MLLAALLAYGATVVCAQKYLVPLMATCWALTLASALLRAPSVLQATLLLSLLSSFTATVPLPFWPLPLLIPLLVFAAALVPLRRARVELPWARLGSLSTRLGALSLLVVLVASTALLVWVRLAHPDLTGLRAAIPPVRGLRLALLALCFSLGNALMEELIWRGVLLSALDEALSPQSPRAQDPPKPFALLLQALSFGCAHYYGFPSGACGVAMATLYGLMLGGLRRSSHGLLAPVLVHAMADATIFAIALCLT